MGEKKRNRTTTTTSATASESSLSAVPDPGTSEEMTALSEAARSATLSQNLDGATRLNAACLLVNQFERQERERDLADEEAGRPPRAKYARLNPESRARDHLAAACQLTTWHAERLVTAGLQIGCRLSRLNSQVSRGLIPEQLAIDVACRLATVADEIVAGVEAEVMAQIADALHGGDRPSRTAVDAMIDRAVEKLDKSEAKASDEEAAESRTVRFKVGRNGMTSVWAKLTTKDAELLRRRIDTDARAAAGDGAEGTMNQLRADALAALSVYAPAGEPEVVDGIELGQAEAGSELPKPSLGNAAAATGQPIRISVISAAARGEANQVGFVRGAYASFEWLCRELLEGEDSRVRFEIIDPAPGALDEPEWQFRYFISNKLAERIRLRDGTCRHPGCQVDAADCDIDHVIAFDKDHPEYGGPTAEWNLVCLCREHHREKTFGTNSYRTGPLGDLIITTETGHVHRTRPSGPLARARNGMEERLLQIKFDRLIGPDGYFRNPPGNTPPNSPPSSPPSRPA